MIDFEQPADDADDDEAVTEIALHADAARPSSRGRTGRAEPIERVPTEKREMLINVSDSDECRIALLCEGRLEELYIERATAASNVGNIYKGRVTNVEPSIQAAFIDFGLPLNGFLHISDLHPKYFPESRGEPELVGKKTPRRHRPPIQNCLRRGQEIVVQVIKEGIGTKGPTLSSYISLPGRFLVMMPDMDQLGVSRKIEDEEQRRQLREALAQLSLPKGMGFIVRTAGMDRTKRDLQRDLNYLARLWRKVVLRLNKEPAPAELYKESDLVIRTIRDLYDSSLSRIIVDSSTVAGRVRDFLSIASPRSQDAVVDYKDAEPMFHRYGIESEIDKLSSKLVPLPCGGSLVIEQTEALVAIDVNSGRFRVPENAEETAYRVNIEAVDEIARQLRLRDLGGLIICDLIDMTQDRHRRTVERRLAEALKKHKERAKLLRISRFGILEMTRQRQRPSFAKSIFRECPRCNGSGRVKTAESAGLDVMRQIRMASQRAGVSSVDVSVSPQVAHDLLNRKRHQLTDLERATAQTIRIHAKEELNVDDVQISCTDRRGRDVLASPTELEAGRNALPNRPGDRRPAPPSDAGRPHRTGEPNGDRRRHHNGHRDRPGQEEQRRDSGGRRRGRRRGRRGGH
jgi:ribonuclease E